MADSVTNWSIQPQDGSQVHISDSDSNDDVLFGSQYAQITPSVRKNLKDTETSSNNPRNGLSNHKSIRKHKNGITGRKRTRSQFQEDQDQSLPNGHPPPKRAKTPQLIHEEEDEDDDLISPIHHNQNHNRKHNASKYTLKIPSKPQRGMLL